MLREKIGRHHLKMMRCCYRRQSVLLRFRGKLLREGLLLLAFLLPRQRRLDRGLHLIQRPSMRCLLLFDLDDVIAEFGPHQA